MVVAGCEDGADVVAVVVLPRAPNKAFPELGGWLAAFPNMDVAGLEEPAGGAPAGVVEGIGNMGLAGVVVVGVVVLLPKRPPAGAAVAPPPKSPPAGAVVVALPKRPPVDFGAAVVEVVAELPPPKRFPLVGAVDVAPKSPPEEDAGAPPNKPDAADFCMFLSAGCPNAEVALVPADDAAEPPNENPWVGGAAVVPPNMPPVAGAVDVVLFNGAADELPPPKLKAMAVLCNLEC